MKYLIFSFPFYGNVALISGTQHTMFSEFDGEWGKKMPLTLGSQVPSAYPAMCGIQRDDKKKKPIPTVNMYVFIHIVHSNRF